MGYPLPGTHRSRAARRHLRLGRAGRQLPPGRAHWYLAQIAVTPGHQGRGYGTALLRSGLERCDREGLPVSLESGNPRNRSLYERHGFRVLGEIQIADSPPVWPMLRPPGNNR